MLKYQNEMKNQINNYVLVSSKADTVEYTHIFKVEVLKLGSVETFQKVHQGRIKMLENIKLGFEMQLLKKKLHKTTLKFACILKKSRNCLEFKALHLYKQIFTV